MNKFFANRITFCVAFSQLISTGLLIRASVKTDGCKWIEWCFVQWIENIIFSTDSNLLSKEDDKNNLIKVINMSDAQDILMITPSHNLLIVEQSSNSCLDLIWHKQWRLQRGRLYREEKVIVTTNWSLCGSWKHYPYTYLLHLLNYHNRSTQSSIVRAIVFDDDHLER